MDGFLCRPWLISEFDVRYLERLRAYVMLCALRDDVSYTYIHIYSLTYIGTVNLSYVSPEFGARSGSPRIILCYNDCRAHGVCALESSSYNYILVRMLAQAVNDLYLMFSYIRVELYWYAFNQEYNIIIE